MDAIIFDSVTKNYKDPSIRYIFKPRISRGVEDLTFAVRRGETFGLLGLNGAGKTTTFKLMLGLLKPDKGEILVGGFHPYLIDEREKALSLVGYLPEISYFNKNLTVYETMKFLLALSAIHSDGKIDKPSIEKTLEMVGLSSALNRKVGKLSKGMMQRLAVAQSLIHDPEILIYDEPTSGLDPVGIKEMRNLIEALKRNGKTIILSSHITSEVEKLCDRVAIIHKGRLLKIVEQKEFLDGSGAKLEEIFVSAVQGV